MFLAQSLFLVQLLHSWRWEVDMYTHGSPADRGSSDAYYGRPPRPHWHPSGAYIGERIDRDDMTPEQIKEYHKGYDNQIDRKEWD